MELVFSHIKKNDESHYLNLMKKRTLENLEVLSHLKILAKKYCEFLYKSGYSSEDIAESYLFVVNMIMEEELYFVRNKKYRYSSFSEVKSKVYDNKVLMEKYMLGLAMTQFLWIPHMKIFSFFQKYLNDIHGTDYLEIGPGHGLYFTSVLLSHNFQNHVGIDISETSIELTRNIINSFNEFERENYKLMLGDINEYQSDEKFDFIVLGEVLEHVENPKEILRSLKKLLKKNGKLFITTCANSPALDHIYLFNNVEEIRAMILELGYSIDFEYVDSMSNKSYEIINERKLSLNYAAFITGGY